MSDRNLTKSMDTLFPQRSSDRCRVCEEPVVDGRWNYCSERCRDIANAVQAKFLWPKVREQVLERDDYTCQQCGLSKAMASRAYWHVQERIDERTEHFDRPEEVDAWRARRRQLTDAYGVEAPYTNFFHVDHIERIADGGHKFDEANLRTLCKHCHHAKTAEENRQASIEQRPEIGLDEYL